MVCSFSFLSLYNSYSLLIFLSFGKLIKLVINMYLTKYTQKYKKPYFIRLYFHIGGAEGNNICFL